MVDGISAINHGIYLNDSMSQVNTDNKNITASSLKYAQDSVSFTGNDEEDKAQNKKEKTSKSHIGAYIISAAIIIGAVLTGKYFDKIKGFFSSKGAKDAVKEAADTVKDTVKKAADTVAEKAKDGLKKANDKLTKAKQRVHEHFQTKKHKIKNTSSTGAGNQVTLEQEHRAVTNINTQNVNAETRNTVDNLQQGLVSQKQQAAYDASIAHQPMTAEQIKAKTKLDNKNAKQRAKLNSVENNSEGSAALKNTKRKMQKAEKLKTLIKDGSYLHPDNKNIYFVKNGEVLKITTPKPNSKGEYEILDPSKIAKHLAKNNIDITKFT